MSNDVEHRHELICVLSDERSPIGYGAKYPRDSIVPTHTSTAPHATFSVIVPTYERPELLAACLSALAGQVYPREQYEVIVVDDGSAFDVDDVRARLEAPFTKFQLIKQTNAGPAAARNTGAAVARHAFLAFIDDDCAPHPDWLHKLSDVLRGNPNALVGGRSCNPSDNLYAAASQTIMDVVYAHFNRNYQRAVFFPSHNMAISRKRFLEVGGFDPSFRWSEDRDLCDRVAARGWQLVAAPDAIVDHGHVSGLIEFFKQHFEYGRGAWQFHRSRVKRGSGRLRPETSFYLKCFREPFRTQTIGRAIRLAMLMSIWQVANASGFFFQAFRDRRSRRKRTSTYDEAALPPGKANQSGKQNRP